MFKSSDRWLGKNGIDQIIQEQEYQEYPCLAIKLDVNNNLLTSILDTQIISSFVSSRVVGFLLEVTEKQLKTVNCKLR